MMPEILKTLKMMVWTSANKECGITTADKLERLISYAISVKNLSCTLEASGMKNHFTNFIVMQELVSKLPAQIKLNWTLHIGEYFPTDYLIWRKLQLMSLKHFKKGKRKFKCSRNITHMPAYKGMDKSIEKSKCGLCNRFHTFAECVKFASLKLFKRWNFIKANKLFCCCLKKHSQFQCSFSKCLVDDCEFKHHKLLHKLFATY